jgi:non-ribosomal peptide synthetase component F
MDPGTAAAVIALAERGQQTPFSVLAAACGAILGRYSGHDRLLVGVAVAHREPAEVEHVLGFLVDTIALRIDLTGDPSFAELVRRVSRATRRAWEHRDLPFDHLVAALRPPRDPPRSPIVQVNFAYHPAGSTGVLALHGCTVTEERVDARTVKFELTLRVEQTTDGAMISWVEFDPDAFDDDLVERLLAEYHELLATAVASPERRISELTGPTLTEALVARLFADTLGLTRVAVRDEFFALGGQSLQLIELMNRIAARTGQVIALAELYQTASVAEIAAVIDRRRRPHG